MDGPRCLLREFAARRRNLGRPWRVCRVMHTLCACVLLALLPALAWSSPVAVGRMEYRLSWNGIPAATATVDVVPDGAEPGSSYRVGVAAQTGWLVDLLWRLRAFATARFTTAGPQPLGFRYDREINRERSTTEVEFERAPTRATGTLVRRGQTKVVDVVGDEVLDPITAVFHALSQPLGVGETYRYEIFTGESRYRVELVVRGDAPVTVAAGTYPAWEVEPRVWKVGTGLDRRLEGATIWVSQAPVRTVLRIRSQVFIGAVNCDLQQLPTGPPAARPS